MRAKSYKNGILSKGSTENIELRLKSHIDGMVNFTSNHPPRELVLVEAIETRSEAMRREKSYKTE